MQRGQLDGCARREARCARRLVQGLAAMWAARRACLGRPASAWLTPTAERAGPRARWETPLTRPPREQVLLAELRAPPPEPPRRCARSSAASETTTGCLLCAARGMRAGALEAACSWRGRHRRHCSHGAAGRLSSRFGSWPRTRPAYYTAVHLNRARSANAHYLQAARLDVCRPCPGQAREAQQGRDGRCAPQKAHATRASSGQWRSSERWRGRRRGQPGRAASRRRQTWNGSRRSTTLGWTASTSRGSGLCATTGRSTPSGRTASSCATPRRPRAGPSRRCKANSRPSSSRSDARRARPFGPPSARGKDGRCAKGAVRDECKARWPRSMECAGGGRQALDGPVSPL